MNSLQSFLPELGIPPVQSITLAVERDEAAIAHGRGFAEGCDAVRVEMAAALAEQQLCHEQELVEQRKAWVAGEGLALGDKIVSMFAELEHNIGQSLQHIMMPFLHRIIPQAAMVELESTVKTALQDDYSDVLHISGPDDLVTGLKANLLSAGITVVSETSSNVDVKVRAKGFSITSRIQKWSDDILGAAT
jgi:hypothetical protein